MKNRVATVGGRRELTGRDARVHQLHHGVVVESRGVRQEMVNEHPVVVARRELREVLGHRMVDAEQAVLGEHHDQRRGDRLRHRHDVERVVERNRPEPGALLTDRLREHDHAAAGDEHDQCRRVPGVDVRVHQFTGELDSLRVHPNLVGRTFAQHRRRAHGDTSPAML